MIKKTINSIPAHWDNVKFERDFNCVAYAENGKLVVVSADEIEDLEDKVRENADAYAEKIKAKQDLLKRLSITEDEAKLLFT